MELGGEVFVSSSIPQEEYLLYFGLSGIWKLGMTDQA